MTPRLLLALLALAGLVGCGTPESQGLVSQPRGWEFVEAVGGLRMGTAHRNDQGVFLPIECDVSGLHATTGRPASLNSGIACDAPLVRMEGRRIMLTLNTSTATKKHHETRCPPADLGDLAAGAYEASYRDPQGSEHPLGPTVVPR